MRNSVRGPIVHIMSPEWTSRNLPSEPVVVAYEPKPDEWVTRTRIVNKMAAGILVGNPVCFAAEFAPSQSSKASTQKNKLDVLRCSVGFLHATYPLKLWRSTWYHIMPSNRTLMIEGDDGLFSRSNLIEKQWEFDKSFDNRLDQVLAAVRRKYDHLMRSDTMIQAISDSQSKLETESRELEGFYFGGPPGMVELQGVGDQTISKERAVEAEYRARLRIAIRRHTLVTQMRILSIGRVLCSVNKKSKALPFVTQPLLEM